ncbi:hypothetical protein ACHAXT_005335 [Thalassiosira profunda]
MNLALLNPFRQPDRIDSTLSLPRAVHPPRPKEEKKAAVASEDAPATKKRKAAETPAAPPAERPPTPEPATDLPLIMPQKLYKRSSPSKGSPSKDGAKPPNGDKGGDDTKKTEASAAEASKAGDSAAAAAAGDAVKSTGDEKGSQAMAMEVDENAIDETQTPKPAESKGEEKSTDATKTKAADGKGETAQPGGAAPMEVDGAPAPEDANAAAKVFHSSVAGSIALPSPATPAKQTTTTPKIKRSRKKTKADDDPADADAEQYWTACYAVAFDRRGTSLASGHASGLVPVHDFGGRTLRALYGPPPGIKLEKGKMNGSAPLTRFAYGTDKEGRGGSGRKERKRPGPKPRKKKLEASPGGKTSGVDDALASPSSVGSAPAEATSEADAEADTQLRYKNGVTSLSWDRRGRTLLAGAIGDRNLRLMDNTHPLAAAECTDAVRQRHMAESAGRECISAAATDVAARKEKIVARSPPLFATMPNADGGGGRVDVKVITSQLGRARLLRSRILSAKSMESSAASLLTPLPRGAVPPPSAIDIPARRHPALLLALPSPLGGPVQLHPQDAHAGVACMIDGGLGLFHVPPLAFYEVLGSRTDGDGNGRDKVLAALREEDAGRAGTLAYLVLPPGEEGAPFVTCAAFGKHGDVVWAVTKCGNLLGFRVTPSMMDLLRGRNDSSAAAAALAAQKVRPDVSVKVPGGAAAWQIVVSRNGRHLLINSADCSLRLYDVAELTAAFGSEDGDAPAADIEPRFSFQDNISKAPWAACDFSGDGECVVGGCNSYPQPGDNYKLFLWNCVTGELVDQLTGPVSSLYSLSCHPARPFVAVGTSDGTVDVWGARLDWVAFAPDFQALRQNEVYEEREDEFDVVVDGDGGAGTEGKGGLVYSRLSPEDEDVDVTTIDQVPAFDSDSEPEEDVFFFDTRVDKLLAETKQPGPKKAENE